MNRVNSRNGFGHDDSTINIGVCIISPAGFGWQVYVVLLLLSFLFFLSIAWSKDLGNYNNDLHLIFRVGRHIGVDVQSGIGFQTG